MKKVRVEKPFVKVPDNVELIKLIDQLAGHGITQKEVAETLGISPGQLSRVRKGERRATWKHVRALREHAETLADKERSRNMTAPRPLAISIDRGTLSGLSAASAVQAFRDLLWARALQRGIPVTRISISSDILTADGGVDASILEGSGTSFTDDELLSNGRRFQIKTGDFRPWQPGEIDRELFGNKPQSIANLGDAIQRMLRDGKEYVLVCFGTDPVDSKLRTAKDNLAKAFKACGFPDARVDVWGQTQLMGLFQQYPSLCLWLRGHDHQGFRFWSSWAGDADMQPAVHYGPETHQLVEELRQGLQSGEFAHLRLIGEPGVGKTRLALEITRAQNLAPATLYLRDGRTLLNSSFMNELIQSRAYGFVVLVVDDCSPKDSAEIWNVLKPRSDRVRLVTIDHGPEESADDKMRILELRPVGREQIVSILKEYGIGEHDANRWAEHCEGCPRVAHVVGENLRQNRADLLQPPATVNVWERFIVGRDDANSEEVQLRKIVLRYVSLFERFGFEPPVEDEAKFIAGMAEKCDSRVTWPRFQSLIANLRERRIIQGGTTLYITPRLLHVRIYREYWALHGAGFDIEDALLTMPQQLRHWFIAMLKYAGDTPVAEKAIDRLLSPRGNLHNTGFVDDGVTGGLLMALAEASPKVTLQWLQRTLGKMGTSELHEIRTARQEVVWALETLAVWENCFLGSAELLLKLAEAENADNGNNASGTFVNLFSLIPGMATTQTPAARRNSFLREVLDSDVLDRRRVGLAAAKCALSTYGGSRLVRAEHQGLRQTIEFWCPKTYGELWDAYREVWEMLTEKLSTWNGHERQVLIQTIVSGARSILNMPPLTPLVMETLESLVDDPEADLKELVDFVHWQLRYGKNAEEDTKNRLVSLKARLDGHDFTSRLRRYVKYATMDDTMDDGFRPSNLLDEKFEELAREGVASQLLQGEFPWLMCEDSSAAYSFGIRVASHDSGRALLPTLLSLYESLGKDARLSFVCGYLAYIFRQRVKEWESLILSLAERACFQSRFADIVIATGISDSVTEKVMELCDRGLLDAECLHRWWFSGGLQQISEAVFLKLIDMQLATNRGDIWNNAVHMFHAYYLIKNGAPSLPNEATFQLLTRPCEEGERGGRSVGYYWSRLAAAFIAKCPERAWDLFRAMVRLGLREWSILTDFDMSEERVLKSLFRSDPERGWDCIAEAIEESEDGNWYGIQHWLGDGAFRLPGDDTPGLIQFVPASKLFAWMEKDIRKRGYWIASALPKTLDHSPAGRLTREFIVRYGKDESLCNSLWSHFHSRSWCGSASARYRKLREEARQWLVDEKNPTVVRWIESYIDGLGHDIKRAEIEEERRF